MSRKEGNKDWDFGYQAYHNHTPRDSNPKPEGSQAYEDWEEGWDCADSDCDDGGQDGGADTDDPCMQPPYNDNCDCDCDNCTLGKKLKALS